MAHRRILVIDGEMHSVAGRLEQSLTPGHPIREALDQATVEIPDRLAAKLGVDRGADPDELEVSDCAIHSPKKHRHRRNLANWRRHMKGHK